MQGQTEVGKAERAEITRMKIVIFVAHLGGIERMSRAGEVSAERERAFTFGATWGCVHERSSVTADELRVPVDILTGSVERRHEKPWMCESEEACRVWIVMKLVHKGKGEDGADRCDAAMARAHPRLLPVWSKTTCAVGTCSADNECFPIISALYTGMPQLSA
jgi:hypothetical protein